MDHIISLTPRQIVEELDKYIIGQHDAKRNVAIALRNRIRRLMVKTDIQKDIVPNNILMIKRLPAESLFAEKEFLCRLYPEHFWLFLAYQNTHPSSLRPLNTALRQD